MMDPDTKEFLENRPTPPTDKGMSADEFKNWVERNRIARLEEDNARMKAALMKLACLDEGPVVHGGFDAPGDATLARETLAHDWIGPCVHGRDPWERCGTCTRAGALVAWAMAAIKSGGR